MRAGSNCGIDLEHLGIGCRRAFAGFFLQRGPDHQGGNIGGAGRQALLDQRRGGGVGSRIRVGEGEEVLGVGRPGGIAWGKLAHDGAGVGHAPDAVGGPGEIRLDAGVRREFAGGFLEQVVGVLHACRGGNSTAPSTAAARGLCGAILRAWLAAARALSGWFRAVA